MCEIGGAEYLKTSHGVVFFRVREDGATLRLWAWALKSPLDVELAVKNHLEPTSDYEPAFERW